jgi:acid phosphatase
VTTNNDYNLAASVKTVVDLLETGGISWAVYQEDMPSTGYTGTSYAAYRRKHK